MKKRNDIKVAEVLNKAFWKQHRSYLGESDEANLIELKESYSEIYSDELIEIMYFYAATMDVISEHLAKEIKERKCSVDDALKQMSFLFNKFGENERKNSLDRKLEDTGII